MVLALTVAGFEINWQVVALFLAGGVGFKIVKWASQWLDTKGVEFVTKELQQLQKKLNENSMLGQTQADDALIGIAEHALPEVMHELSSTLQKDLADGRIDTADWKDIGKRIWVKIEPQVRGGANDYLKNSSFQDGEALATMVAKRFFALQSAQKKGLVTEAGREDGK
jgi:hypothetical protein